MSIGIKVQHHLKRLIMLGGVLAFFMGSAVLMDRALAQAGPEQQPLSSDQHIVSIHDRGEERVIVTKARTVGDALEAAGVEINAAQDVIEPALESELVASKYNVNIYRARPVTIVDGAVRQRITTAQQTPEQIAKAADITLYPEDVVTTEVASDLLLYGADMVMSVDRATPLDFTLYGRRAEVRTRATTVKDFLEEKDITIAENDSLSVPLDVAITAGMSIELWRDGTQTITAEEEVDFPVEQIQDANRAVGYKEVRTPGQKGSRNVTYEIEMKNGKEVSRKEIASVTTKEPKKQVEVVGTKNNYSGSLNEWLYALRMCETHGNYQTNTGNGYYGAYQFLPATWNAIASRTGRTDLVGVMPHQASPADQDAMVIANTNATSGLSTQHPGCYSKLGLSNKPPQ